MNMENVMNEKWRKRCCGICRCESSTWHAIAVHFVLRSCEHVGEDLRRPFLEELEWYFTVLQCSVSSITDVVLDWTVVGKAKLSIFQSIFGHELWVVTERTRWRIQVAEMSFLRRVARLSLGDGVRSFDIRRELGVCWKEPAEVVRFWTPSFGGVLDRSNWEEAQNFLGGLHSSSKNDLRSPQEDLERPAKPAGTTTQPWIGGRRWMDWLCTAKCSILMSLQVI